MDKLKRKNGRYYWRSRVPLDLVAKVGRSEVTRSLATADPMTARRLARLIGVRADEVFALIRNERDLSPAQIDALVRRLLSEELSRLEQRINARSDFDPEQFADGLDTEADDWRDALRSNEWSDTATETVDEFIAASGINAPKGTPEYNDVRRKVARAMYEALRIASKRAEGDYTAVLASTDTSVSPSVTRTNLIR